METTALLHIPIEQLYPHPRNPRGTIDPAGVEELAASIKEKGILEPLLGVPQRDKGRQWMVTGYTVVAGHRRLAAAKLAGLTTVPLIHKEAELADAVRRSLMARLVKILSGQDWRANHPYQPHPRRKTEKRWSKFNPSSQQGAANELRNDFGNGNRAVAL